MLPHPVDVGEPQVGSAEIRVGSTRNETPQGAMAAVSLDTLFVPWQGGKGNTTPPLPPRDDFQAFRSKRNATHSSTWYPNFVSASHRGFFYQFVVVSEIFKRVFKIT